MNEGLLIQNNDMSMQQSMMIGQQAKKIRVKPKFFKLLGQIMNDHVEPIFSYLDIKDLARMRASNKLFLAIVHEYYPKRLRLEVERIKIFQERNYDNFLNFMKIIDSQIPISNKNWLDFDLNSVITKLRALDKKVITNLRGIKNLGKLSEAIFAPFCIIFGYNKNSNIIVKNEGWKKISGKILADPDLYRKLNNIDMDNLSEADMLDAFVYLNLNELELDAVRKYSPDIEKMIIWCQGVLSYHILIHPFTYRNDKSLLQSNSDLHEFVSRMNLMLNKFYKFKRYLINLNIMNIPIGEYVFNLQHNREKFMEVEHPGKFLNENQIALILSYLPYNVSFKFSSVNKKWRDGFRTSIDLVIHEILKEIFYLKIQASEKLYKRIPILFENNIFSNFFIMVDDILNAQTNFLSKEQLNDVKNIKLETDLVKIVMKSLCLLLNEKVERKTSPNGDVKMLYLEKVKTLILSGQLLKSLKNINKLDIPNQKLNSISEELMPYLTEEKLNEVKRTNRGVFQLLIWELLVIEFNKIYNPFDFISADFIMNRFENEEIEIIRYYCEVMNYLKYNLKIKYRLCKTFNFSKYFELLNQHLSKEGLSTDMAYDNDFAVEYSKIAKIYFETKDLIPQGAKPAYFERIYENIQKLQSKQLKTNREIVNEKEGLSMLSPGSPLGTIKEENSINLRDDQKNLTIYQKEMNKLQLLGQINKANKNKTFSLNEVPMEILIKNVLFFLDINSLPKFSMANKKCNESVKTHIFIRLFFLNKEKKLIENENAEIIKFIEDKRKEFFEEYEIDHPNKDHACKLMNSLAYGDIIELKQCFKKSNKNYETFIAPLVILMGQKPEIKINPDGSKTSSYLVPAQKILNNKNFINQIKDMELESIPYQRFRQVEKFLDNPAFEVGRIKQYSPCLHHLISWIMGVIEFHRVIRKYSLSSYDFDILSDDEIKFCNEMDNILVLYYKLLRYANSYCKSYEKNAQNLMANMNLGK